MRKVLSSATAQGAVFQGIKCGKSVTIPGQSQTIRQLYSQYVQGKPITGSPYHDDPEGFDLPDFNRMDVLDHEEFMIENKKRIEELKERAKSLKQQDEERVAKRAAEIIEIIKDSSTSGTAAQAAQSDGQEVTELLQ